MKSTALLILTLISLTTFAVELKPSNTPKVLMGGDGARVEVLEVNGSKQILAHFSGIGGEWEGKTFLWAWEDTGRRMEAFTETKQGTRKVRSFKMHNAQGDWMIFPPQKTDGIHLSFDKKESAKLKADDVLKTYKP